MADSIKAIVFDAYGTLFDVLYILFQICVKIFP